MNLEYLIFKIDKALSPKWQLEQECTGFLEETSAKGQRVLSAE